MQKIFFIVAVLSLVQFAVAKSNLNICGEGRLDRDKDGIPCENVCRR